MSSSGAISLSGPGKDFKLPQIPGKLLPELIHTMQAFPNDTTDFSKPYIRTSLQKMYPIIITAYVIVVLVGVALNVAMLVRTLNLSKRLRVNNQSFTEYLFTANISVLNIVMCLLVVPLSLAIMLIQNWIFGRFLCYAAPILQDVPLYGGLLSLLGNTVCRYRTALQEGHLSRSVSKSVNSRTQRAESHSPAKKLAAVATTWLAVAAAVAPQAGYIQYYDLEASLGTQFKGVCLCIVDTSAGIVLYNRVLLVVMYILPLLSCAVLLSKSSSRLAAYSGQQGSGSGDLGGFPSPIQNSARKIRDHQYENVPMSISTDGSRSSLRSPHADKSSTSNSTISRLLDDSGHEQLEGKRGSREFQALNLQKQEIQLKIQKFQILTTLLYGLCLCPLMILRLLKNMNFEVVPAKQIDAIMICFVWVAVLQTTATPALFLISHRYVTVPSQARSSNTKNSLGSDRDVSYTRNSSNIDINSYSMVQKRHPTIPCNLHYPSKYNPTFDDHTNHFHQGIPSTQDQAPNFQRSVTCPTHRQTMTGQTNPYRSGNLTDNRSSQHQEASRSVKRRSPQRYERDSYQESRSAQREVMTSSRHNTIFSTHARARSPEDSCLPQQALQIIGSPSLISRDYDTRNSYPMHTQGVLPDPSYQRSAQPSNCHRSRARRGQTSGGDPYCQRGEAYRGHVFQN